MEINLEPLLKLEQAMKKWKIMHIEGLKHLRLIPDLFDAASGTKDEDASEHQNGVLGRVMNTAPSPRLREFVLNGLRHPSEVEAAPEKLTDAIEGVLAEAAKAIHIYFEAADLLDEFKAAVAVDAAEGGAAAFAPADALFRDADGDADDADADADAASGRRHWIDDVPGSVLLARVPWGANRTIEEWLWLCVAVLEQIESEVEVKEAVASYLSQQPFAGGDSLEDEGVAEALERGKIEGCAEVWELEPYLDNKLFESMIDGGASHE